MNLIKKRITLQFFVSNMPPLRQLNSDLHELAIFVDRFFVDFVRLVVKSDNVTGVKSFVVDFVNGKL
jgi:hypothetical protein